MYHCCILIFCWIVIIINQQLTGKHFFSFPSFCILSSCNRQIFWLIGRRLWTFWVQRCVSLLHFAIFCQIVIVVDWQLTGRHSFSLTSFCNYSSCARQTFWLIGRRLWSFFRSKGMYHCCIMKIVLPGFHHHLLATHWKTFLSFPSILYFFHLVPDKHFGWLVRSSGPFLWWVQRYISLLHSENCIFRLSPSSTVNTLENIPFIFLPFVIFHLWLIARRLWTFCWGPKVCMIAAFWKNSCWIVQHLHGHHGRLLQRGLEGLATCTCWLWCFCNIFKYHQKWCFWKLN